MPKWKVEVTRIAYQTKTIEVEAEEAWAAEEKAVEQAPNEVFDSTQSADYEVAGAAQLVEETINVGGGLSIPASSKCKSCGANAHNLQYYDGMLGYEALECKLCGHQEDLNKRSEP